MVSHDPKEDAGLARPPISYTKIPSLLALNYHPLMLHARQGCLHSHPTHRAFTSDSLPSQVSRTIGISRPAWPPRTTATTTPCPAYSMRSIDRLSSGKASTIPSSARPTRGWASCRLTTRNLQYFPIHSRHHICMLDTVNKQEVCDSSHDAGPGRPAESARPGRVPVHHAP